MLVEAACRGHMMTLSIIPSSKMIEGRRFFKEKSHSNIFVGNLCSRHVRPLRTCALVDGLVFSSMSCVSETWNLASGLYIRLRSWEARALSFAFSLKRGSSNGVGDHRRRVHRVGHRLAAQVDTDLSHKRRRMLYRWAGSLERTEN